jgi:probable phosphoglycerate mutase
VRARRTAELAITLAATHVEIIKDPRLHEQDVGEWAGRRASDVFTAACLRRIEQKGKDFKPPGGESMNDVGRRMLTWLDEQSGKDSLTVFAFTHGGAIRALASTLHDLSHAQAYPIRPANGSVSLVRREDCRTWRFDYLGRDPADALGGER